MIARILKKLTNGSEPKWTTHVRPQPTYIPIWSYLSSSPGKPRVESRITISPIGLEKS